MLIAPTSLELQIGRPAATLVAPRPSVPGWCHAMRSGRSAKTPELSGMDVRTRPHRRGRWPSFSTASARDWLRTHVGNISSHRCRRGHGSIGREQDGQVGATLRGQPIHRRSE